MYSRKMEKNSYQYKTTADQETKKQSSLNNSLKEGALASVSAGIANNYFSAYAIALKSSTTFVGLITALPNLLGPLSQSITPKLMRSYSRKKIVLISVLVQTLMWLPMMGAGVMFLQGNAYAHPFLLGFLLLYTIFGSIAGPAWISWMGDMVDEHQRGAYFGLRGSLASLCTLLGVVIGGLALDFFKSQGTEVYAISGFFVLFGAGMLLRLLSLVWMKKQYEPTFKAEKTAYFSFWSFLKKIRKSNYGRFTLSVSITLLATNIAGPYFSLYMLRDLEFSYTQFMTLNTLTVLATFLSVRAWGKIGDKTGFVSILKLTGLLVILPPLLWFFTVFMSPAIAFFYLIPIFFLSGIGWAGFNLAAGNFLYDAVTPERRSICSAYSSILNGFGVVLGTLLGGFFINHMPTAGFNAIMIAALLSAIGRFFVNILISTHIQEVRPVQKELLYELRLNTAESIFNIFLFPFCFKTHQKR